MKRAFDFAIQFVVWGFCAFAVLAVAFPINFTTWW